MSYLPRQHIHKKGSQALKDLVNPICLGSLVFIIQLSLILLASPLDTIYNSWIDLASHWDSEWYSAIAKFGYINLDGPHNTGLRNANVVFFPGFPYLARILILNFNITAEAALLIVSQIFTLMLWILIFYIIRNSKLYEKICAILIIMFFPTSWFLYTGYSESCFIFATLATLWLFLRNRYIISALFAILMTATRIIGTPVLIVPFLSIFTLNFSDLKLFWQTNKIHEIFNLLFKPTIIAAVGVWGVLGFLIYCQIEFNSWHLYFDMEKFGWKGEAYPLFIFKLATWLPPPFGYQLEFAPTLPYTLGGLFTYKFFKLTGYTFSEALVPIFMWISIVYSFFIFRNKPKLEIKSLTWYFAAILMLVFSCISLYTRYYESMSRCLYPVWIFLILADLSHPQRVLLFKLKKVKLFILTGAITTIAAAYWLQLLERFFLNWWVA